MDKSALAKVVAAVAVLALLIVLGEAFGYLRAVAAGTVGVALLIFGGRFLDYMTSVPPEPDVMDVRDYDLRYVCTMCGLELKVEVAAKDRAPRHCGEAMVLVGREGKPPLHPV